jgi:hypothetical protein
MYNDGVSALTSNDSISVRMPNYIVVTHNDRVIVLMGKAEPSF